MQQRITPKVSVCVVTYNHEKYIRQCLQSIVDQETDFDFEVIVGDDCSLDGTRVIVQEFAEQYPGIVKPIFHEKNIGATKNYFSVHDSAKGEYVAHCDGDDYWLPNKLIYQVRLLDERQHLVFIADYYMSGKHKLDAEVVEFDARKLLAHNNPAVHSSKLYRARYKIDHIKERDYLDFEISIRQLGTKRCCGLSRNQTTIYRENTAASIRKFVNARLLNTYINLCQFLKSIGIEKREIDRIYNEQIRSFIKNAVVLNHSCGVRDIRTVTKRCDYRMQAKTVLYLLLAENQGSMRLFRYAIVAKRKLIELLR